MPPKVGSCEEHGVGGGALVVVERGGQPHVAGLGVDLSAPKNGDWPQVVVATFRCTLSCAVDQGLHSLFCPFFFAESPPVER